MPQLYDFELLVRSIQVLYSADVLSNMYLWPIFKRAVLCTRVFISTKINEALENRCNGEPLFLDPIEHLTQTGNETSLVIWKSVYEQLEALSVVTDDYSKNKNPNKRFINYVEDLVVIIESLGDMLDEDVGNTTTLTFPDDYDPSMFHISSASSSDSSDDTVEPIKFKKVKRSSPEKAEKPENRVDYLYCSADYRKPTPVDEVVIPPDTPSQPRILPRVMDDNFWDTADPDVVKSWKEYMAKLKEKPDENKDWIEYLHVKRGVPKWDCVFEVAATVHTEPDATATSVHTEPDATEASKAWPLAATTVEEISIPELRAGVRFA